MQFARSACEEWRALNLALWLVLFVKDAPLIKLATAPVKLGKLAKKERALFSRVRPERMCTFDCSWSVHASLRNHIDSWK